MSELDVFSGHYDALLCDLSEEWDIEFQDLNDQSYDLNMDDQKIAIHNFGLSEDRLLTSPYFRPQILLAIAESLRMARHVEWLDGVFNRYHPETILLMGRICVADTMVHKIDYAWQMKKQGDDSLWKYTLCSDIADMAQSYIRVLETCFTNELSRKKAMETALNMWFSCESRIQNCDHDTLNMVDDMIAEGEMFDNQSLQANAVTCLTLMNGQNTTYLSRHLVQDILKTPYYRGVNDVINQTHLMQTIADMNKFHVNGLVFHDADLASRFTVH